MELNSNALITYDYLIEMLGSDKYPETERDRVIGLINWVSSRAVAVAGRPIMLESRTVVLDGSGTPRMYLPIIPVVSVDSIVIDDYRVFDGDLVTDYYLDSVSGVIALNNDVFPKGFRNTKIVYSAGYTTSNIPEEVKKACLEAIQTAWNRQNDNSYGITNRSDPNGISISYETRLSNDVFEVFANLRIPRV
ncbi:MAG: hypothetical protein ACQ5SW_00885 [Sphaerochaetaceae bacterium]